MHYIEFTFPYSLLTINEQLNCDLAVRGESRFGVYGQTCCRRVRCSYSRIEPYQNTRKCFEGSLGCHTLNPPPLSPGLKLFRRHAQWFSATKLMQYGIAPRAITAAAAAAAASAAAAAAAAAAAGFILLLLLLRRNYASTSSSNTSPLLLVPAFLCIDSPRLVI